MSQADFDAAAAAVKQLTQRPSNDELLQLYGLFKQVTVGDNNTGAYRRRLVALRTGFLRRRSLSPPHTQIAPAPSRSTLRARPSGMPGRPTRVRGALSCSLVGLAH